MVYMRYSFFDILEETMVVRDSPRLKRFEDLSAARAFIARKEEGGRFLIDKATLFRKAKGKELKLVSYVRDENNDLKEVPLV